MTTTSTPLSRHVYEMASHSVPRDNYQPKIFAIAAKLNDEELLSRIEKQLFYLRKKKLLTEREHAFLILDAIKMSCCCGSIKILFLLLKRVFKHGNDKAWFLVYTNMGVWGKKLLRMMKKTKHHNCEILLNTALSDCVKPLPKQIGTWV